MRRLQVQWENIPSKILGLIFILCFQLLTATAQHDYYWSNEQKITLTEDRTAVSVVFAEKQNEADLQAQMRRIKTVASFDFQASAQRLLIHFNRKVEKMEIARLLDLETEAIRHISYAQQLKDGFELWLTPKIVLALKRGRQHSDIERAFPDVPMKFSKAAFDAYTIIELAEIEDVLPLANKIKESGLVAWCHPDFYAEKTKYVDPFYADQFQLNNTGQVIDRIRGVNDIDCNAPEAWSITKGDANLIVAVIDDGVENHEDLLTASGQSRVLEGYTPYTNGNGRPNSDGAHGQSCAGIIAASHNEIGVRGIAPEVQILPINIFAGAETIAQIANAFNFARINNAAILSNSWGYSTCEGRFDVIDSAIENVVRNGRNGKGSLVTFAAGNSYADCVEYPANLETVMGVGAVTNRGLRSDYSNYGRTLDIVAPSNGASGVRTIDRMGAEGYANGNYTGNFGGTSAACPVVSGVAALLLSAYPDLTAAQATSILLNTANDMGATGKDEEYGYGRVDAYAALLAAGGNESFGYCAAQGQSVADEWIGGFELGDYSNSSDAQTYSDFTDEIITLEAGQTYPISITPNYSGQSYPDAFRVWIDFDQNEVFEDNELVFEAGLASQTVSGNVQIPAGLSGETRLRVAMKYEAFPSACEIFEYGEVEDYTVRFQDGGNGIDCDAPINLNAINFENSNANLTWNTVATAQTYDVRIRIGDGDWIPFQDLNENNIILTNFEAGVSYEFSVRSNCADGSSAYSSVYRFEYTTATENEYCAAAGATSQYQWIDLIELNELSNPSGDDGGYADYTNLTANIQRGRTETIYISKGPNTDYLFDWNIYIDFNQNGEFEADELMVKGASESNDVLYGEFEVPTDALLGQTRMRILMKYEESTDPCGTFEYGEVEDYSVNIQAATTNNVTDKRLAATALGEAGLSESQAITLFPNPATDFIQVRRQQLGNMNAIQILNVKGQVVWEQEDWTGTIISVAHLPKGIYFLTLMNGTEKELLRFVKAD